MRASLGEGRLVEWNRLVRERVGEPLRPEQLDSVFIVVPGSSGDVVLATSVVRWVKERNPNCKVSFAVKRANLPLLHMCPGVDEKIEFVPETPMYPRSRRRRLAEYAGRADAVIYPVCDPEDMDLLQRLNFLETLWLLSGVPDGMPPGPHRLWMEPPDAAATAARVLARTLSADFADALAARARRQPAEVARHVLRTRSFSNAGWKNTPRLLRYAASVRKLAAGSGGPSDPAGRFVIVSSEAYMYPAPPGGLFKKIIGVLRSQGRIVLHNVLDVINAAPGTVPLVCSYPEFLSLRQAGVPFVGWRSGLCDIAAASPAPMCVIHPGTFAGCNTQIQANMTWPIESFGFGAMNVAANCLELVCDSVEDLDAAKLATILD